MQEKLPANIHLFPIEEAVTVPASSVLVPTSISPNGTDNAAIAADDALWITDELLFNYQRCSRRAYLDLYGDQSRRDPPSDYLLKLRQDSRNHQQTVLGEQPFNQPDYPRRDWLTGAQATLELMQQGAERISQGVLLTPRSKGIMLVSCPDLLVREPGKSRFGDWHYIPVDIKLGKRPKLDYQITAAFHAYVLSRVQGAWSEASWLMLRHRGPYAVNLEELVPRMEQYLEGCIEMFQQQQEPEVFIAHSRCELCHWFSHCYSIAEQKNHLSLLPGVTPSRYVYLENLNITTLEALANTLPRKLELLPGFGPEVAHKLVLQAQSTLWQKPLPRLAPDSSERLLSEEELPTAPVELYFDIEAAPEHNLVYLHGVLVVDRIAQTEIFHPLVAESPELEGDIWEQFLELVWRYPTAPIYHFCPYEPQTVKRLAEVYGAPRELIEPLVERFVDLHERFTRVVTLPIERYALKQIARWIGFDWRDADANGAQSIYWYAQWLDTGDRTFLDAILRYNEDDCRATHRVKDWLVEFNAEHRLLSP